MKLTWDRESDNLYRIQTSSFQEVLEPGIYKVNKSSIRGLFLTKIHDSFTLPSPLYGRESSFVGKVVKTYQNTSGNLGVILNGLKGTGKTVTAKLICNELNLPVIIISEPEDNMVDFINRIEQDAVVFIDEFEKVYDGWDASLLPLMDGAMSFDHRIIFLLTTNNLTIDYNLLARPSRVRYVKNFSDLPREVIEEVVDDLLDNKDFRDSVISVISKLSIITIDLVRTIVEECNIHNIPPTDFFDVLNVVDNRNKRYRVTVHIAKEEIVISNDCVISLNMDRIESCIGDSVYANNIYFGCVNQIISPNAVKVMVDEDDDRSKRNLLKFAKGQNQIDLAKKCTSFVIEVERTFSIHRSFLDAF